MLKEQIIFTLNGLFYVYDSPLVGFWMLFKYIFFLIKLMAYSGIGTNGNIGPCVVFY